MSLPQAIVAITSPMSAAVTVGTPQTVGAVVFANESPYAVQALAGGSGKWVSPQTADVIYTNSAAFDGSLALTTNDILDNSTAAPSFVGLLTTYAPGEPIPGTYPVALPRMSNVGNTVTTTTPTETPANTFNQDLFTSFVLANLLASKDPIVTNQLDVNPGIAYLSQADRGLLRITPVATTFLTSAPNATYYLDLNPDASFSFGTSHSIEQNYITIAQLTTDASGNISAVTDERPLNTILLGSLLGSIGTPQLVISTSATVNGPLEATTATLRAPPVLFTGSQETGYASGAGVAAGAANAWGFGVNFKTVMTNVPTISLNASSSSNCSAAANNITKYGFSLVLTATAAGSFFWVGSYTTVGN